MHFTGGFVSEECGGFAHLHWQIPVAVLVGVVDGELEWAGHGS